MSFKNKEELKSFFAESAKQFGFDITSKARTKEENAKVGGVPNSQHLIGAETAIDYSVKGKTKEEIDSFASHFKNMGLEVITKPHGTGPHVHVELPKDFSFGSETKQQAVVGKAGRTSSQQDFFNSIYNSLYNQAKKMGFPSPETIAMVGATQSSLETGYGKSTADSNNYFGIKGGNGPKKTTQEVINGKTVTIQDNFRGYASMDESVADYLKLMQTPRYASVYSATNVQQGLLAQGKTGYATDNKYSEKLMGIYNRLSRGLGSTPVIYNDPNQYDPFSSQINNEKEKTDYLKESNKSLYAQLTEHQSRIDSLKQLTEDYQGGLFDKGNAIVQPVERNSIFDQEQNEYLLNKEKNIQEEAIASNKNFRAERYEGVSGIANKIGDTIPASLSGLITGTADRESKLNILRNSIADVIGNFSDAQRNVDIVDKDMATVMNTFLPDFRKFEDSNFNVDQYIKKNGININVDEMPDYTRNRLFNSRSEEEFNFFKSYHDSIYKQNEEAMSNMSWVGQLGTGILSEFTNPLTLVGGGASGAILKKAVLLKNAKYANRMLGGIGASVVGESLGYAATKSLQGEDKNAKDIGTDIAMGLAFSSIFKIPAAYGLAKDRLGRMVDKDGYERTQQVKSSILSEQKEAVDFLEKNPNATEEELTAHLDEKFKDDIHYSRRRAVNSTPGDTNLDIKKENITGENKDMYVNGNKIIDENAQALDHNKRLEAQEQLSASSKAKAKEEADAVDNIKSKFQEDAAVSTWEELSPEQKEMWAITDNADGIKFNIISQAASNSVRTGFTKAINGVKRSFDQMTTQAHNFIDKFYLTDDAGKKVKGPNRSNRVVEVNGKKYTLSYKNNDLLRIATLKGWGNIKNESLANKKVRQLFIDKGGSPELINFIRKDILEKEKAFFKNNPDISKLKTGKMSKDGTKEVLDGTQIYTPQDAKDAVTRFYNGKASELYKQAIDEVSTKVISGKDVHMDITPKLIDEPEVSVPPREKLDGEIEINEKKQVLTKEELFDKAKIDKKYIDLDPREALKKTIRDKIINNEVNKIESNIDVKEVHAVGNLIKTLAKKFGAEKSLEYKDGFLARLLAKSVACQTSVSTTSRFLSYIMMENPIGAVTKRVTTGMKKLHDVSVIMRGVDGVVNRSKQLFAEQNQIGHLKKFFNEAELDEKFNNEFRNYRGLSRAEKEAHPYHKAFKEYDNKMTELAKIEAKIIVDNKLPGHELLKNMTDEDFEKYQPMRTDTEKLSMILKNPNQRKAFVDFMINQYMGFNKALSREDAAKLVKSIEDRLLNSQLDKDGLFLDASGSMLSDNFINDVLNKSGIPIEKVNSIMESIKSQNELKKLRRAPFDYNTEIKVDGAPSFKLLDIMDNNVANSMSRKINSAVGTMHLKNDIGIYRESDFADLIQKCLDEGANPNEVENLREMFAEIRGLPYGDAKPGGLRIVSTFLRSIMLAKAGFTQLIEYAGIMNSLGVMAPLRILMKSKKNLSRSKRLAKNEEIGGVAGDLAKLGYVPSENVYKEQLFNWDMLKNGPAYSASEMNMIASKTSALQRVASGIEDIVARLSFQKSVLATQQLGLIEELANTAVFKVIGKKVKKTAERDFERAGLDFEAVKRLIDSDILVVKDGNLVKIKTTGLSTQEMIDVDNFKNSIVKLSSALIQETLPGETGRWVHSEMFKAMMMMRSYSISSIFKQTGRIYNTHGTMGLIGHTLGATMVSAPILYARSYLTASAMSDEKREEYMQKYMNPQSAVINGFRYASPLSVGQDAFNFMTALAYPDASDYGNRGAGTVGAIFPIIGGTTQMVVGVQDITDTPAELATNGEATFNDAKKMVPIVNTTAALGIKSAYNTFIDMFSDDD